MTLRGDLEKAISRINDKFTSGNSVPVERAVLTSNEWASIRDHGPALLEAVDAESKWKEMTDQARAIQHTHLDKHEGDVYHAMQFLASKYGHRWKVPLTKPIDAAREGEK